MLTNEWQTSVKFPVTKVIPTHGSWDLFLWYLPCNYHWWYFSTYDGFLARRGNMGLHWYSWPLFFRVFMHFILASHYVRKEKKKKRHVHYTGIRTFVCILVSHMLLHLGTLTSGKLPSQHVSFVEQPFGSPLNKTAANSSSVSHPAGVRHLKISGSHPTSFVMITKSRCMLF